MDEHITQEELTQILKEHGTGTRDKGSNWRGRMEKLQAGAPLILYPKDKRHAHILKCTAYQAASQYGGRVKVRTLTIRGQLTLFIFRA